MILIYDLYKFVLDTKRNLFQMNRNDKTTELIKMLADAGIRPSVQRLAIFRYISSCESHPKADEIYESLVKDNPTLSRTTVFNSVRLLAEKGLINDIDISADSTRYDSTEHLPHAHFMCRNCKRIFDIPMDMSNLPTPVGFQCDNVNVLYKGFCPECSKQIQV